MDSISVENSYAGKRVVTEPETAHLVYDSVEDEFLRFTGWKEYADSYQVFVDDGSVTVTLRKYRHPSNRYYLIYDDTFSQSE